MASEAAGAEGGGAVEIPVFELPLALLPTEQVPLHVFEQRYKLMISWCLDGSQPFGVLLRTDEGARSTGCAAVVGEVLERFDDGRMNIVATGRWRFRVLDRREGPEFPMATVQPLAEPDPGPDPAAALDAARAAFSELVEAAGSEASAEEAAGAFEIAARVELAVEVKQRLLEVDDEVERLQLLAVELKALSKRIERARRIAERARGNGHGPIGGMQAEP